MHTPITCSVAIAVAMLLFATTSWPASTLTLGASYTASYTDNINLSPVDPERDFGHAARFGLSYFRQTPKTDANVTFGARREFFETETQEDQTFYTLDAQALWRIVPERFTWSLAAFSLENQINVLAPPTPDNIQNASTLVTGPDFLIRLGDRSTLQLGVRYAASVFEETAEDSRRVSGTAAWLYRISPRATFSVNLSGETVKFKDDPLDTEFDRRDLFFRASGRKSRSEYVFDIGGTSIDQEGTETETQSLARFSWNRRLTSRSATGVSLAREISDIGRNIIVTGSAAPQLTLPSNPRGFDLFVDKRVNIFYTTSRRRTTVSVQLFARDQDHDVDLQDEENTGGSFILGYRFRKRLSASLTATATKTEFINLVRLDRDRDLTISLSYRLGRTITLGGATTARRRNSNDPAQDFRETRILFEVGYNLTQF